MAAAAATRRDGRIVCLAVLCALLAAAFGARAQLCDGALSAPGASIEGGAERFALIARQCPALAVPTQVHRAAQLDLYRAARAVTIEMPESKSAAPAAAPAAPAVSLSPPDAKTARVLSLTPVLMQAARDTDLDPLLLHAIAHVESRHNAQAVSPAGARGALQVMPATGRRFGVADPERLLDGETNVRAGAAYLRTLMGRYGGDLKRVLAAYNAGEGAVDKHGGNVPPYPETQAYVRDVLAVYRRLTSEFAVSPTGTLIARGETQ
jgi:soluble lytic murein transglycosylase-like protein